MVLGCSMGGVGVVSGGVGVVSGGVAAVEWLGGVDVGVLRGWSGKV